MISTSEQGVIDATQDEWTAISHALEDLLVSNSELSAKLLQRLNKLHGETLLDETARVLSIAGKLCTQFEEPGLARQIYAEAVDGCHHLGPRRPGSSHRHGARARADQLMPT